MRNQKNYITIPLYKIFSCKAPVTKTIKEKFIIFANKDSSDNCFIFE